MILKGGTSGAEAKITNLRFIVDFASTVQGSFFIPNPNVNTNPVFQTGERTFQLTDSPANDPEEQSTTGADIYNSSGSINTVQENVVSTRNAKVIVVGTEESRAVSEEIGTTIETDVIGVDTTERVVGERRRNIRRSSKRYMGNSMYKHPRRVAARNKAKAMAKARIAKKNANRACL